MGYRRGLFPRRVAAICAPGALAARRQPPIRRTVRDLESANILQHHEQPVATVGGCAHRAAQARVVASDARRVRGAPTLITEHLHHAFFDLWPEPGSAIDRCCSARMLAGVTL